MATKALNENSGVPTILARGVASPNIVRKDRSGTHYLQPVLIQHKALSGGHYIPPTSKRRI